MTRKKISMGFGKGLLGEQKRRVEEKRRQAAEDRIFEGIEDNSRSVLEQSNIDDLIATVELRQDEWAEAYGDAEEVAEGPVLLDLNARLAEAESAAAGSRELVSIPRRPTWNEGMSVEELAALETETFMEWRRNLKQFEQDRDGFIVVTPYERNLDFWRQLWRCMERSDLLVQVLDARDPDFYFCQDLERYVRELGGSKRLMLLVNKADFLSSEQRQRWTDHFEAKGVDAIFFSALNELLKQEKARCATAGQPIGLEVVADGEVEVVSAVADDVAQIPIPDSDDDGELGGDTQPAADASGADELSEAEGEEAALTGRFLGGGDDHGVADVARLLDELRARLPDRRDPQLAANGRGSAGDEAAEASKQGVVGFVGYPNVGKSTVINALVGAKKVGMSRTPGKTKHIQTLQLPEWGFTLCDAPGLVFPSVVATRAHLVINNTVPLDDLRECFSPISLIVEKIGFAEVLRRYRCASYVKDAATRSGDHVLDETHSFLAAFAVSRNHFLRVGVPDENWAARKVLRDYCTGKLLYCEPPPSAAPSIEVQGALVTAEETTPDDEDDFDDLEFVVDDTSSVMPDKMTKKKQRYLQKQLAKGLSLPAFEGPKKKHNNARAKALA